VHARTGDVTAVRYVGHSTVLIELYRREGEVDYLVPINTAATV